MDNMVTEKKYIFYSSLKRLKFWDYYTLSNKSQIDSKYELVELSEVLNQRKINIVIDDSQTYKRCRVQTRGKGVILRDEILGKGIKTKKQQPCKKDDFLVAEIDAKVGGYGIVPDYLENAIVSGHYFLFEIDKSKLIPEFLSILVKCKGFSKQVKATGSTNYAAIRPYHVLEYLIPLPSITEQKRIVDEYYAKINLAKEQEKNANELEISIENYFYHQLGITKIKKQKERKLFSTIGYKEVDRWAVETLGKISKIEGRFQGKFPLVKLRGLILSYQYGLSEKSSKEQIGPPMLRMNNINNSRLDVSKLKFIDIDNNTLLKYRLNKGDLLFNRTNSKELVGKTALFYENGDYTFASYLIRVKIDSTKADNKYINNLFNSSILQYQKDLVSRQITGQANINAQEMQDFLFPIPPLKKQIEIGNKIEAFKKEITELRRRALNNRELALKEFENEIFKPCN